MELFFFLGDVDSAVFFDFLFAIHDRIRWHLNFFFLCHGQNEEEKNGGRDWRSVQVGVSLLLPHPLFPSSGCGFWFVLVCSDLFVFGIRGAYKRDASAISSFG